jgi:hypothetical protein
MGMLLMPSVLHVSVLHVRAKVNYSEGEPLQRLTKAISDWDGKTGTFLEEKDMLLSRFAQLVQIPYATLVPYVCKDKSKRKAVGCCVGPTSLLDGESQQFVVDVMRRKDRANDGMNRREGIDMVQDLKPELTRNQAVESFRRVRAKNKDTLTGLVKANRSTDKRSAITVEQQYRWHQVSAQPAARPRYHHRPCYLHLTCVERSGRPSMARLRSSVSTIQGSRRAARPSARSCRTLSSAATRRAFWRAMAT